ncbi:MAG: hypothetical protein FJZ76_04335 [Bacteroidetes bacterium]|nr:hypothetical protein [Bacteroidota bacterium]
MAADAMFSQPKELLFEEAKNNKIPLDRLVIGDESFTRSFKQGINPILNHWILAFR